MQINMNKKVIAALTISAALTLPSAAMAKVTGACANCHTMHNSQDGVAMASLSSFVDPAPATADIDSPTDTPNIALLRYQCIGCHTGQNDGTNTTPYIYGTGAQVTYGTNTLAGGNFLWVDSDDSMGHNVVGIAAGVDGTLSTAPGGTLADQITCAGATTGCHTVGGGHHNSGGTVVPNGDGSKLYVSGSTTNMADAYRMLSGVRGIEDDDWEYTTGVDDHNYYYGEDRANDAAALTNGTISSLCAKCHGDFHTAVSESGDMSSPWLRHPTDFDMGGLAASSEYAFYTSYSLDAPVANSTIDAATTATDPDILDANAKGGLGTGVGRAIVTCISCHRAHGSPNPDLLRWSYTMNAGSGVGGGTGCFICHTTKDDI